RRRGRRRRRPARRRRGGPAGSRGRYARDHAAAGPQGPRLLPGRAQRRPPGSRGDLDVADLQGTGRGHRLVRTVYKGQSATEGVALGRLVRVDRSSRVDSARAVSVGEAFGAVDADLDALEAQLRRDGQDEAADIVGTNRLMAADPDLRAAVDAAVAAGTPAETALAAAVEAQA